MKRWGRVLEGLAFPFLVLGGNAGAIVLVLARHAQLAILFTACLPVIAGVLQSRLARQRSRRKGLRRLQRELRNERGIARLSLVVGVFVLLLALLLPAVMVVIAGFLGTALVALRTFVVVADSAIKEKELKIVGSSAAEECSCIERWARRLSTMPGRLGKYLAKAATTTPPIGELTKLRALPVVLIATSVLVFAVIGGALGAERAMKDSNEDPTTAGADAKPPDPAPPIGKRVLQNDDGEPTYAQSCPTIPDPLEIGHGLGLLFRSDGAFKAGCGTEALQVLETGAWFARGICARRLRSLAVAGPDGDRAILYGAAARFALHAAESGKLVSAEGASPAGGDVYIVETLAGSYGFARQASTSELGEDQVRDCTDVTETGRPFAELNPPMMLHWRDLVRQRNAWSWPLRENAPGDALAFASYPGGEITARGACLSEFSCYLDVDGVRWPGNGTSYVSFDEFAPHIPPSEL